MQTTTFTATCTNNSPLSPWAYDIRMTIPDGCDFDFHSGAFVLFNVPDVENPEDFQPRAYSIASDPTELPELKFCIMNKEGGRATRWIQKMLKPGDEVHVTGPMGVLKLHPENPKPYLFLATGTGIAPMRSMIRQALITENDTRPMTLLFGNRCEDALFWTNDFRSLESHHENLTFHPVLSQPSENWDGYRGRFQEMLPDAIPNIADYQVYFCGNPMMVSDMKAWLAEKGVEKSEMYAEGYA